MEQSLKNEKWFCSLGPAYPGYQILYEDTGGG